MEHEVVRLQLEQCKANLNTSREQLSDLQRLLELEKKKQEVSRGETRLTYFLLTKAYELHVESHLPVQKLKDKIAEPKKVSGLTHLLC